MSRSYNAEDFRQKYLQARSNYEEKYKKLTEKIHAEYTGGGPSSIGEDESREVYIREYFVNQLLNALNWRLNISPDESPQNMIAESPVTSISFGTRRFLDYFGFERETLNPLLIVETKRPRSSLPKRADSKGSHEVVEDESEESIIADGLSGRKLTGEWNKWLLDLKDYVQSLYQKRGQAPRRAVLTNGNWLILFIDPAKSFLSTGRPEREQIRVFKYEQGKCDDFIERRSEIFKHLEHQIVLGKEPAITVAQIEFHLTPESVTSAMHGLWLRYTEHHGQYAVSPIIEITPVIFLQSIYGAWLRVKSGRDRSFEIPHKYDELDQHLQQVDDEASDLLRRIGNALRIKLTPSEISHHYQDKNSFDLLKGVKNLEDDFAERRGVGHYKDFSIVTGEHTHFLKPKPSIANCQYHDWKYSDQEGCAEPQLFSIQRRSTDIDHRSFFIDGENHHCTHRDVAEKKREKIMPNNQMRCGLRSSENYDPFCEIWAFEKYLCCRTCVFEEVCTSRSVFKLPCEKQRKL